MCDDVVIIVVVLSNLVAIVAIVAPWLAYYRGKMNAPRQQEIHVHHHHHEEVRTYSAAELRRVDVGPAPPRFGYSSPPLSQPRVVRSEVALGPGGTVDHDMYSRLAAGP
jgi:hypothetical protein